MGGYVQVDLLYNGEVIDNSGMVDKDLNTYESELPIGF